MAFQLNRMFCLAYCTRTGAIIIIPTTPIHVYTCIVLCNTLYHSTALPCCDRKSTPSWKNSTYYYHTKLETVRGPKANNCCSEETIVQSVWLWGGVKDVGGWLRVRMCHWQEGTPLGGPLNWLVESCLLSQLVLPVVLVVCCRELAFPVRERGRERETLRSLSSPWWSVCARHCASPHWSGHSAHTGRFQSPQPLTVPGLWLSKWKVCKTHNVHVHA